MAVRRVSLKRKLMVFIVSLLIFTNLGLGIPSYFFARQKLEEKGEVILSNAVHMAIDEIETMNENVEAGIISMEDAQEKVRTLLVGPKKSDGTRILNTPIDLGKYGYFLAYNDEGYEVMHPTLEGQFVYNVVSPGDEHLLVVQEQLRIGRKGGTFAYDWYYPHQEKIGRKLSYVKSEPHWGWTVVATAYASDFNRSAIQITILMVILFLVTVIGVLIFTRYYMNKLLQPIFSVTDSMKQLNRNKLIKANDPYGNDELSDLVNGYNRMIESLSDNLNVLKNREKQLKRLAFIDELSGLPNYNFMEKYLNRRISKDYVNGIFLFLDIKNLKLIKSMYGMSFGDDIIKDISKKLRDHKPAEKTFVARLGGNEFGIWIGNTDEEALLKWIETSHDFLNQEFYDKRFEMRIDFTVSYLIVESNDMTFENILQMSTVAMQYAKDKNLDVVKYSDEIYNEIEHESVLKIHAEKGLNKGEFFPVYQEKVDILTDKVIGVEALARWESEALGFIGPNEFIPILNKTKLIIDFTEKIIDYVLSDYKKLVSKYDEGIAVSINISPLLFMSDHFVSYILEKAAENKVPTHCIVLEITEDVLMDNPKLIDLKVSTLRQAGFKISLDDFGTGYSSLNYLQKITLDEVKIDKSLIDDIVTDKSARHMLHSIVEIFENLGYISVAEGVETEEQVQIVKEAGCKIIQGYYYSKPSKLL